MEISFTWSEPEVAQEVVKAWIEIYMEERTQALGRKSLYAFYEAQTADSAAQIKSYKAQILKHLNGSAHPASRTACRTCPSGSTCCAASVSTRSA